jgi:type III restriction enzyme
VCLRIPTGGGKTLLAAHAAGVAAREWPGPHARPFVLWLVPSDPIRTQTLKALATPDHPVREALAEALGADVRVCELESLAQVAPADFDAHAVVCVAAIQGFRVEDTSQRNAYATTEDWEPHFRSVPAPMLEALREVPDALVTPADVARAGSSGMLLAERLGQPHRSLANWIALRRPVVIVDEAHNTKTTRSFEALARLRPSLVLELTATPVAGKANVLFHVSAQALQAEQMIKMPIALTEHLRGWEEAVFDAVQTRAWLEAEAQHEEAATGRHIRPIVLFQAQQKGGEPGPDALRQHLVQTLKLPADQVKVHTGAERGLDGIDLAARECPVRFVITMQALREGWDCPFAYVLCSVQNIRSATNVEQLLGRVLRMPYAERRSRPALNRAYAHVTESETGRAAHALADRLIEGMGFDPLDVASMFAPPQPELGAGLGRDHGPLFAPPATAASPMPVLVVELRADAPLPAAVAEAVAAGRAALSEGTAAVEAGSTPGASRRQLRLAGPVDEGLAEALLAAQPARQREEVRQQIVRQNALVAAQQAPAHRGVVFAPVPRLVFRRRAEGCGADFADPPDLLEREAVVGETGLDLLASPVRLPGFELVEQPLQWELLIDSRVVVTHRHGWQAQADEIAPAITVEDLARHIAADLQRPERNAAPDVTAAHLRAFVLAALNDLLHARGLPLAQLVRHRHVLRRTLEAEVAERRTAFAGRAFRQLVLDGGWDVQATAAPAFAFRFDAAAYPVAAGRAYDGPHRFAKHWYPTVADLRHGGEELSCALAIDTHPRVKHWVRNLDSQPQCAFWLPVSAGRFYPDFVAELNDGRVFVAEYKGEHLRRVPAEIEKAEVGRLWAERSRGTAAFAMLFRQEGGRDLRAQLDVAIG